MSEPRSTIEVNVEHLVNAWVRAKGLRMIAAITPARTRIAAVLKNGERLGYVIYKGKYRESVPVAEAEGIKIRTVFSGLAELDSVEGQ